MVALPPLLTSRIATLSAEQGSALGICVMAVAWRWTLTLEQSVAHALGVFGHRTVMDGIWRMIYGEHEKKMPFIFEKRF